MENFRLIEQIYDFLGLSKQRRRNFSQALIKLVSNYGKCEEKRHKKYCVFAPLKLWILSDTVTCCLRFMIFKHEPIFPRSAITLIKFRSNLLNCYAKKKERKNVWKNCIINFYDYDRLCHKAELRN